MNIRLGYLARAGQPHRLQLGVVHITVSASQARGCDNQTLVFYLEVSVNVVILH